MLASVSVPGREVQTARWTLPCPVRGEASAGTGGESIWATQREKALARNGLCRVTALISAEQQQPRHLYPSLMAVEIWQEIAGCVAVRCAMSPARGCAAAGGF